jgi:rod shape-determining protein MreD
MTFGRAAVFVLVGWLALIVTASLETLLPLPAAVPNICLLVVLYLGLSGRGSPTSHVGLALALGYLVDLFSGSPRWLHALSFGLVMVVARGASSRLLVTSIWQQVLVALLASLGHGALLVALSAPMYDGEALAALRIAPMTALFTSLLAPLAFAVFRKIDRRLSPDPRALRMGV